MTKSKRVASRGALIATDLALVDRMWSEMPAREAIALVEKPPRTIAGPPGAPEPFDATGLSATLSNMASKKTLGEPLVRALAAKRALGIPWRWITRIPDRREETRSDERMLRWAEAARLQDLSAGDVVLLSSVVEKTMIGATEAKSAFLRWGTPAFAASVESADAAEVESILLDAWDDAAPLAALAGVDDEGQLFELARDRLRDVRAFFRFAHSNGLAVIPWSDDVLPEFLGARADRRR